METSQTPAVHCPITQRKTQGREWPNQCLLTLETWGSFLALGVLCHLLQRHFLSTLDSAWAEKCGRLNMVSLRHPLPDLHIRILGFEQGILFEELVGFGEV